MSRVTYRIWALSGVSAALLLTAGIAARADDTAGSASPQHKMSHNDIKNAANGGGETVEQRIASLHAALKITPDEESNWTGVAQAMRENAADMDQLVAQTSEHAPSGMSALDDLKTYQKFAQAHVDGLKKLIPAFETLYGSMPDAQKKVADAVFQKNHPSHG